eukprot:scaffold16653_cov118-Isochrysis_galbana.AAC.4
MVVAVLACVVVWLEVVSRGRRGPINAGLHRRIPLEKQAHAVNNHPQRPHSASVPGRDTKAVGSTTTKRMLATCKHMRGGSAVGRCPCSSPTNSCGGRRRRALLQSRSTSDATCKAGRKQAPKDLARHVGEEGVAAGDSSEGQ